MIISTANIQNFPDMTPKQVREDVTAVKKINPDLSLWQEIGQDRDFDELIRVFGNGPFGFSNRYQGKIRRTGNVIGWRRSMFDSLGPTEITKIGSGLGAGTNTGNQWLVKKSFKVAGLPQVDAYCLHYIQGAYSKPGQVGDADGRRKAIWKSDYDNTRKAVLASVNAGHIAIVGGDWNRHCSDIPAMHSDMKWVIGGKRIDGIAVVCPKGWEFTAGKSADIKLNSDHNARYVKVDFKMKKVTRPVIIQRAVEELATSRETLKSITSTVSPYTAGAKKALDLNQQAINALLEAEQ
jgi:hypothetical protein